MSHDFKFFSIFVAGSVDRYENFATITVRSYATGNAYKNPVKSFSLAEIEQLKVGFLFYTTFYFFTDSGGKRFVYFLFQQLAVSPTALYRIRILPQARNGRVEEMIEASIRIVS